MMKLAFIAVFLFLLGFTHPLQAQNEPGSVNQESNEKFRKKNKSAVEKLIKGYPLQSVSKAAQSEARPNDETKYAAGALTWFPFALVGDHMMIGYEHAFTSKFSLKLNLAYGAADFNDYYNVENLKGFYGELQARYYPAGNGINGLYFGGFILGKSMGYQTSRSGWNWREEINAERTAIHAGVLLGYQGIAFKALTYELYLGGGMVASSYTAADGYKETILAEYRVFDNYSNGMHLHAGLSIGILTYRRNR